MVTHPVGVVNARRVKLDDGLILPYGGQLIQAFVPAELRSEQIECMANLPRIELSQPELHDLEMLACGAYSPLGGFMNRDTYAAVCDQGQLPSGLAWGLPVTLAVTESVARGLELGRTISLVYQDRPVASMAIEDIFPWDPEVEAKSIYKLPLHRAPDLHERHLRQAKYLIGGAVSLLATRMAPYLQAKHSWPRETRGTLSMRGWHRMTAVHLNNPWQRAHEYVMRCALEASDALLLHSAIDRRIRSQGLSEEIAADASQLLLQNYFPVDRIIVNPLPRRLLNAGVRSAIQHAILSQNYGCERIFIVPALLGPTSHQQDTRDWEREFVRAAKAGLDIKPVFMHPAFHCEACGGLATEKSCPHESSQRVVLSDEEIQERLLTGEHLPPMVARPEIARALSRAVSKSIDPAKIKKTGKHLFPHASEVSQDLRQAVAGHKAAALWMTGLSGSGKSTVAHRLERELLLSGHRVYVLDADTLRQGLNKDLGFSDADRRENLRRAGEVVKVMVDAGIIVIASFISPFAAERKMVRDLFNGNFFEVYVEASLADCEARDPKGLYKRARAGQIPHFTGISSPYEAPVQPELVVNTTHFSADECVRKLMNMLSDAGVLRSSRHETGRGKPRFGVLEAPPGSH